MGLKLRDVFFLRENVKCNHISKGKWETLLFAAGALSGIMKIQQQKETGLHVLHFAHIWISVSFFLPTAIYFQSDGPDTCAVMSSVLFSVPGEIWCHCSSPCPMKWSREMWSHPSSPPNVTSITTASRKNLSAGPKQGCTQTGSVPPKHMNLRK